MGVGEGEDFKQIGRLPLPAPAPFNQLRSPKLEISIRCSNRRFKEVDDEVFCCCFLFSSADDVIKIPHGRHGIPQTGAP